MPTIYIDNQPIDVPAGATVLDAAGKLGIEIPTLCHLPGRDPATTCMVCLVRVNDGETLLPACATVAAEGMRVESQSGRVIAARRTALELLLSDHLGDCVAPCQTVCPAGMNIPLMIRLISAGRAAEAIAVVKRDIAIPAILGRICPAPCQSACRRREADAAVAICLLKRYVADADLASDKRYQPDCAPASGRKVAVVGAGPAGLSAAYYIRIAGHSCTLFDEPGGALRQSVDRRRLPIEVLDAEIDGILAVGVELVTGVRVGESPTLAELRRDFDAVVLATGPLGERGGQGGRGERGERGGRNAELFAELFKVPCAAGRIIADRRSHQTPLPGLFAIGGAVRPGKRVGGRAGGRLAVRAAADGKEAAVAIDQYLVGRVGPDRVGDGPSRPFNIRIGKLLAGEIDQFMQLASKAGRVDQATDLPAGIGSSAGNSSDDPVGDGLDDGLARGEALRCLHCDCRKADDCKLRTYAQSLGADPKRYRSQRRSFVQYVGRGLTRNAGRGEVIYEPGKCIDCGICVRIASQYAEPLGLTFVGRGFDVQVAVPFDGTISEGLTTAAAACVQACPTGAMAFASM